MAYDHQPQHHTTVPLTHPNQQPNYFDKPTTTTNPPSSHLACPVHISITFRAQCTCQARIISTCPLFVCRMSFPIPISRSYSYFVFHHFVFVNSPSSCPVFVQMLLVGLSVCFSRFLVCFSYTIGMSSFPYFLLRFVLGVLLCILNDERSKTVQLTRLNLQR
ncbi:hypothetical protein EDB19DRAFT_1152425 [Suillus lakei]|nr:hypothetical protein EDB19DRAFT_1152425 [Suillus lakei]